MAASWVLGSAVQKVDLTAAQKAALLVSLLAEQMVEMKAVAKVGHSDARWAGSLVVSWALHLVGRSAAMKVAWLAAWMASW